MNEANETRAFYRAIADWSDISKKLAAYRRDLAKTKAAEEAFNNKAVKDKSGAQAKGQNALATAIRAANLTIVRQNRLLQTNAKRLAEAATAAKAYTAEQRKISKIAGPDRATVVGLQKEVAALKKVTDARKANAESLKEETRARRATSKDRVQFVEEVGKVNQATGEVIESTEKVIASTNRWSRALAAARPFMRNFVTDSEAARKAQEMLTRARSREQEAIQRVQIAQINLNRATERYGSGSSQATLASIRLDRAQRNLSGATDTVSDALRRMRTESSGANRAARELEVGVSRVHRGFRRFGDWRPRLVPPFVALVPIIAAVVAAINPLVSILGTLGPLTLGLASSIGSLSGAFLALPGILSAVVAGISSVIASFGGVGSVFKAYGAMNKALGKTSGGSSGPTQAERAESLADAEWNLAKAQRSVTKAQENLNKAREKALRDLIDLRLEVSRASLTEERAIADLRKAQEEYWNVMADPGSTLGDKLDAAASIKEAEADLIDVRQKNIDNQKELADAERRGVDGSEDVIDAQERLTDALISQRDAQKALRKEQTGEGGSQSAAATAVDEYNKALAELSPSARAFVLAILAMEDQWKSFKRTLQEDFFSQFVGDLDRLPRILNSVLAFLRPSAVAMGQFVKNFLALVDSPEWESDLATIGEQNGRVLDEMGRGGLALAEALKDLVIAAGPFTEWLVGSLATGVENFRDLVETGRETGTLAKWLETAASRLERWWQVIKNVGATLFNYSAAASGFGDWILDNLVEMTAGWAESAKAAREDGSPFQQWLEDIKPLLSEVNGLLGAFFGWFRETAMDPENIEGASRLVALLRDDLGPVLSNFLDTLGKTEIDEKFVIALSDIIESLTAVLDAGGGSAIESFFDVLVGFFDALADFTKNLPPGVLDGILKFLGALAAVSFIGKFTGLTALVGLLPGAMGNTKKIWSWFNKIDKMKFASIIGKAGLYAGAAAVAGSAVVQGTSAVNQINDAATKGNTPEARQQVIDANPAKFMLGGSAAVDILNFIGLSDWATQLDGWFTEMSTWMTDNLPMIFAGIRVRWDSLFNGEAWDSLWAGWNGMWTDLWNMFLESDFVKGWNGFWEDTGKWFDETFVVPVKDAWNGLQEALNTGWQWIQYYIILPFQVGWARLQLWFATSIVAPIARAWETLQTAFSVVWTWIDRNVLSPFRGALDTLKTHFDNGVRGLGDIWNGLRQKFAEPINFVINSVYNDGIRKFWNGINDSLNLKLALPYIAPVRYADGGVLPNFRTAKFATGGVLPGYTPGRDVHRFTSPSGGKLELSGGEAIMRPEWTRAVGGPKAVEKMNKDARKGKFASGGVYGGGLAAGAYGASNTKKGARRVDDAESKNPLKWITDFLSNPLKYATDGLNSIVSPLLNQIGGGVYGQMLGAMPGKIISALGDRADKSAPRGNTTAANGMQGGKTLARVLSVLPSNLRITSTYRTPAQDLAVGGTGHTRHTRKDDPAVDIAGSVGAMNAFARTLADMGGWYQVLYNNIRYPGVTWWPGHSDHVHAAMKDGGVLPNLYDQGGWLKHGQLGMNLSGKPEAVLTNEESRGLKMLLAGSGLTARPASLAATPGFGLNAMNANSKVIDNSVNFGEYHVHNPVPETASESLPRSIRKVSSLNESRAPK